MLHSLAAWPQDDSECAYITTWPFLLSIDYLVTHLLVPYILALTDYNVLISPLEIFYYSLL